MICIRRVIEVKLGKDVQFYYFFRRTLLPTPIFLTSRHSLRAGAFTASAPQIVNKPLGGFSHVFRHYKPGSRRVRRAAFSDIGQDLATGTQLLAAHLFGPAPQEWADPTEETAEKMPIPCLR